MSGSDERTGGGSRAGASRRSVLRAAGTAGVVGIAGCPLGGGGETATFGVLSPTSGPYSSLGPEQRKGAELGVEHARAAGYDFSIEAVYADTATDEATAQQRADEVVSGDGASYLVGGISSDVARSLSAFVENESVIYMAGAAAIPITGTLCNRFVFRFETNTAQIAEACAPWTVRNLGGKTWFHFADYSYGRSVYDEWRARMRPMTGFRQVGFSLTELGAGDFGDAISEIRNSPAEVVVAGMTGGDLVGFVKQAAAAGLLEEVELMTTTASFRSLRAAMGSDGVGVYSGVRYLPTLQTGDNPSFASAYRERFDGEPGNFARVGYESIRTVAKAIDAAGTTDPVAVTDVLAGRETETIFGPNRYRECDHQATNPVWVGRNVPGDGGRPAVDLLEQVGGEEAIPPCSETRCNM